MKICLTSIVSIFAFLTSISDGAERNRNGNWTTETIHNGRKLQLHWFEGSETPKGDWCYQASDEAFYPVSTIPSPPAPQRRTEEIHLVSDRSAHYRRQWTWRPDEIRRRPGSNSPAEESKRQLEAHAAAKLAREIDMAHRHIQDVLDRGGRNIYFLRRDYSQIDGVISQLKREGYRFKEFRGRDGEMSEAQILW